MAYCALHKGKFPDDEPCPFCAPAAPQSDQPEQGVSVDSVEHLAFMLANEVIERTEPRHKRETAFLLLKALRAAPASQPVAPSPGADAEEVAAGYFDPNDIRERWAQLYNRCTFTSDPHAVPYTRYVTVDTATFDEFAHDLPALLESFRAETLERAKQAAHEVYVKWPTQSLGGMDERIGMALGNLQADPNWLARQIAEAQIAELDALETVMDEAGVLAEWGSVAQIRYKNRRRAALAATKSQLTEGK